MSKHDKLLFQILRGLADANIEFDDLCHLLHHLGFEMRGVVITPFGRLA